MGTRRGQMQLTLTAPVDRLNKFCLIFLNVLILCETLALTTSPLLRMPPPPHLLCPEPQQSSKGNTQMWSTEENLRLRVRTQF